MSKKNYSAETRSRSIELLLEGKTIDEVSEETGVNRNTLMSWRQQEKNSNETEFPSHYRGNPWDGIGRRVVPASRYSDDEIITLVRQNPGYGVERFCKKIYPKTHKLSEVRYRITMLLQDHRYESGEDLFDLLQDPSYSEVVSAIEYKRITGKSRVPQGHGRSTSRSSKASETFGKGTRKEGEERNIPLPPQEFKWGDISGPENRPHHNTEIID